MTALLVPNVAEYNAQFLGPKADAAYRSLWLDAAANIADLAVFWSTDGSKVVLRPDPVPREWVADCIKWMGYDSVDVQVVGADPELFCLELVGSPALLGISRRLTAAASPTMSFWGATRGALALSGALRELGLRLYVDLPAPEFLAAANYLDSKIGGREVAARVAGRVNDFRLPSAEVCTSGDAMRESVRRHWRELKPFVLKCNRSVGGYGSLLFPASDLRRPLDDILHEIDLAFSEEPIFIEAPYLVEQYVEGVVDAPTSLTVDCSVGDNGDYEVMGMGVMLMRGQFYEGVAIGPEYVPQGLASGMRVAASELAREVSRLGYRGWFDADFVVDADDGLWFTEINARRTSPTHVIDGLRWLRSVGHGVSHAKANDHSPIGRAVSYPELRRVFEPIRRAAFGDRCIAVITIVSGLTSDDPHFGYSVFGPDRSTTDRWAAAVADVALRL